MILRKAEYSDWPQLLAWRNDALTRQNTQHDTIVKEEEHKAWLQRALQNPMLMLYIAETDGIPVGTIRAELPNDHSVLPKVSWTVAPEYRHQGYGSEMARLFTALPKRPFRAEIKESDCFSPVIAERIGMRFLWQKDGKLYYEYNG